MQFPTCVLQEPTIKSGFMWRQLHDVARMHCSTFAQKGRHPEKAGAGSQGASQSCCGQMRTQRPECQPNLGKGHLGLWILNWFCKMKWHFMLVKLLYTHIYIYPKKRQEPVLVNLMCLSVLRLFQMLRMFITPLVMEPSWSQQSAIWTSFCLDVLAHFFTWIEWSILGCDGFPLRFSETDPTTSNTYICLTLACSVIPWKQVKSAQ